MTDSSERRPALPPKTRRRRRIVRRLVLAATLVVAGMVVTQVVMATPPSADFTINGSLASGQTVNINQAVALSSTSTDPENDIVGYEWDFDFDGSFTVDATGVNASHAYSAGGSFSVALRVTDGTDPAVDPDGAANQVVRVKTVNVVNPPPVPDITIRTLSPFPGQRLDRPLVGQVSSCTPPERAGECVEFDGSASRDPDASSGCPGCTYQWNWIIGSVSPLPASSALSPRQSFVAEGNWSVRLRVTDPSGAQAEKTVPFRVNRPPEASFFSDDATPVINQTVTFFSTSSEPDSVYGDSLSFAWNLDNDTLFGAADNPRESTTSSSSRTFGAAGTYPIKLRITDEGGITREAVKELLVQNSVPNGSFSFGPESPIPGQSVTFSSTSNPTPGKQIVGYAWDFDYQQPSGNACAAFGADAQGASVSRAFSSPGPKTVGLKVTEVQPGGGPETGGCDIVVRTVNVNAPPQASFGVAPSSVLVDDEVTLASTSSDPDGPLIKQEWDLDNDGQFDDANAAVVAARFGKKGTYTLRLRVTDSKGATAIASQPLTVRSRPLKLFTGVEIGIKGRFSGVYTDVRRLLVRAPRGSKVSVRCRGKNCPKKRALKTSKGRKKLRFKAVERKFRPGTKLIVTVTKPGFLSKQTTFTIRRGREPSRKNLCLSPGAKTAKRCPSG